MIIRYTREFLSLLKKQKVIIRKNFKNAIEEFSQNPDNPILNNHALKREWEGYRSINVTEDWRSIYTEIRFADGVMVVYFVTLGTHKDLYK